MDWTGEARRAGKTTPSPSTARAPRAANRLRARARRMPAGAHCLVVLLLAGMALPARAQAPADSFGISQRYRTLPGTIEWASQHWATGGPRVLSGRDAFDPTNWSQRRGSGTVSINGVGQMQLGGTQPRLYVNPYPDGSDDPTDAEQLFRNTEVSVYFRRLSSAGADYGGLVIGLRSGPLGHGSAGGDNCDANTYYARLRNDGDWDFAKELHHPDATARSGQAVWQGAALPVGQWIGVRFAALTRGDGRVSLELWLDRNSGGAGGGAWELLGTTIDDGGWSSPADGCPYPANQIIATGGGVVLLRNTSDTDEGPLSEYRWLSVREVDPNTQLFGDGFETQ